jgi:tetratricopeptide (TPR) repeat protein
MVGFSFFVVSAIYSIFEDKPFKSMVIVLFIMTSCYAVLSYRRNLIWENELTLWNDTVHKSPKKARPYNTRGLAYEKQGNFTQAISDYTKAIEINPSLAEAYNNCGVVYYDKGNFTQAISDYTKAIEINPNYAQAYNNRGLAYYEKQEYDKVWVDVHKAEKLGYKVNSYFLEALKKASEQFK